MATASVGGLLYAFGGQELENEFDGNHDEAFVYYPATDSWATLAPMPWKLGHISPSCWPYKNGILIVGGTSNSPNSHPNQIVYFEPSLNRWSVVPGGPWDAGSAGYRGASQVVGLFGDTICIQSEERVACADLKPN
jgi:hypothetical protein